MSLPAIGQNERFCLQVGCDHPLFNMLWTAAQRQEVLRLLTDDSYVFVAVRTPQVDSTAIGSEFEFECVVLGREWTES